MVNRRTISFTLVLALAGVLLLLQSSFVAAKGGPKILEWQTMVGVPQAFTGTANQAKIRDVPGGIPWMLDLGKGELSTSGHLEVKVRGLVLAGGANAGSNPVNAFKAIVSCLDANAPSSTSPRQRFPAPRGRRARAVATPTSRPTSTCPIRASHRSSSSRMAAARGSRRPAAESPFLTQRRRGRARARPRRSRMSRSHPRPRSRRPCLPRGGRGRRGRAHGPGRRRTAASRGRSAPATPPTPR